MPNQSFDICIPTWNSLEYLKLAVRGIQNNSALQHTIRVHDNASTDGTAKWLKNNNIFHTTSSTNQGFCGVNHSLKAVESDHVMIFNSDMIPLPGWDLEIIKQINLYKRVGLKQYTISSCLIEPTGFNPEYDIDNAGGTDAENFDEAALLKKWKIMRSRYCLKKDTIQYSHPILLPTEMLQRICYLDPDYFPGWASDHDLAARAYYWADCRHFVMLGKSRVYHFSSKTFKKLPDEIRARNGEDLFLSKWNHSITHFRHFLGVRNEYTQPTF